MRRRRRCYQIDVDGVGVRVYGDGKPTEHDIQAIREVVAAMKAAREKQRQESTCPNP